MLVFETKELEELFKELWRNKEAYQKSLRGEVDKEFINEELRRDASRGYYRWINNVLVGELSQLLFQQSRSAVQVRTTLQAIEEWSLKGGRR